ncbi:hypothetical protein AAHN97_01290 [Chitinophaga niabensis]|uniref:hypothetical protein n=1 Tax=Chitinophaga niabensis TaxID=536979 RepID=UPI0031BA87F7
MEKLLEQLLHRWEQTFDDLQTLPVYKTQVKTTRYSEGSRYNLEKFDWAFFPGDGPMLDRNDDLNKESLYEYGFNVGGLPCYVTFNHNYNGVTWEGFYRYSDDLVEYVEFCVNTGVPSALTRMEFKEGRKISLQRLMVNGRAGVYSISQLPKEEIINKIRNDEGAFISTVTRYEYGTEGKIERASSIHISPGIGKFTSYDEYTYDQNQVLEAVRRFFEDGTNHLTYARPLEHIDSETLTDSLARELAKSICEKLARQVNELPIALLELSYQYAYNYIPYLICQSEEEVAVKLAGKENVFVNDYSNLLDVETKPFERLFAQLEQMMEAEDDWELGRTMLRKTAGLLTKSKLFGRLQVTENFAVYAIDWSIEGHSDADFEVILIECGVEMEVIKLWKQGGMLPLAT